MSTAAKPLLTFSIPDRLHVREELVQEVVPRLEHVIRRHGRVYVVVRGDLRDAGEREGADAASALSKARQAASCYPIRVCADVVGEGKESGAKRRRTVVPHRIYICERPRRSGSLTTGSK